MAVTEKHVEALSVAMALAPGVYVRNRMFAFFAQSGVQRARTRAATLRGIVPQLARASGVTVASEARGSDPVFVLRYRVVSMHLHRVVELSATELAALRVLAARSGVTHLPPEDGDRTLVDTALARLLDLETGHGEAVTGAGKRTRASIPPT